MSIRLGIFSIAAVAVAISVTFALTPVAAKAADPNTIFAETIAGHQDVPIAYYEWGNRDGPDVLFIHGFLASTLNWQKQIESELGEKLHLVSADMRGHGSSGKPWEAEYYVGTEQWAGDVAAVIKQAGLNKPVIVAWSYGGFFALDYIRHYGQEAVSGLVLVGTHGGLLPPPPPPEMTDDRKERIRRSSAPNMFTLCDWTSGFMNFMTAAGPLPDEDMDMLMTSALVTPHYIRRFLRERPTDNSDILKQLDIPVLFIGGEIDASASPETIRSVADAIPGSSVTIFEDQGTMPFWYEPAKFNRAIADFVEQVAR